MSLSLKVSGLNQTVLTGWVKVSGTVRQVQSVWVKQSGIVWQVYTSLTATASGNASSSGTGFAACGDPGTTNTVTVTPVGGVAPFTFAWARVGAAASSGPYIANTPTSATTNFSDPNNSVCQADAIRSETWRCTVTDSNSQTATVDVNVELTWADLT